MSKYASSIRFIPIFKEAKEKVMRLFNEFPDIKRTHFYSRAISAAVDKEWSDRAEQELSHERTIGEDHTS